MIRGVEFHDIIKNIFHEVRGHLTSEQLQVNCPKCQDKLGLDSPDGKFNLEINTSKRVFQCWKCDPQFSGSLGKLIRLQGSAIDYELYKSMASSFNDYQSEEEDDESFTPLFLPYKFIPFSEMDKTNEDHLEAHRYLILERGLTNEIINKFRLGFCVEGKYRKRIIIPSYDKNGRVNYFVARSYIGHKKPYDNPKQNKNLIFNEYFINFDSLVFLAEGVFEMFAIPNTTPMLGKKISENLFFKLKEKKPDLIIALDPDATKEEIMLYELLKNAYGEESDRVRVLGLKGGMDIDELRRLKGKEEIIKYLYESKSLTDEYYFNKVFNE